MRMFVIGSAILAILMSVVAAVAPSTVQDDSPRLIETLPAERGGQELIGRKWPAIEFDRVIGEREQGSSNDEAELAVTLYRWWTSGCPYCERSLPAIERWREKYESRGLRTVAVYHPKPPRDVSEVSDEFIVRAARSLGYAGVLALDSDWSKLRIATRGWRERSATSVSFLVDHKGVIRFVHPGLDYFPSDDLEHERQHRDHELLEAAIKALLEEIPAYDPKQGEGGA
jgi:thiol-disulfide isomerase/thioredoxin